MKNGKMPDMAKLLDTSVHEVGTNKNIIDSLRQSYQKNKQPFFDGNALPYAKERTQKASMK